MRPLFIKIAGLQHRVGLGLECSATLTALAVKMQMEDRNRQTLRQDLQDKQDSLPTHQQSQTGEASFLMPIRIFIL
jgi:hypothetical protein